MALKPGTREYILSFEELAVPSYGAMALKLLLPVPDTTLTLTLQSPPTGRWP